MLPEDLKKPIDEIKTASNRVLVICLILTVMVVGTLYVRRILAGDKDCTEEKAAKDAEIKRLNKYIIDKTEEDNVRLKKRQEFMDSVNTLYKKL